MKVRKRHKLFIRGWRHKLIFLFVVYFAGFATAIYCLAPVPHNTGSQTCERNSAHSVLKSDEFATAFNEALRKLIRFSKSAALRTADFIKEEYNQRKANG
jgi:hypothetical protein